MRQGAKETGVERRVGGPLGCLDGELVDGATRCWNDLVQRTGWKRARNSAQVSHSWQRLLDLPSATILIARHRESRRIAGFLITKIYGDTAYVDTIASNSELLACNPNDILMYTFIRNAQELPSVTKMHYAIKSNVATLERFKRGLGFTAHPFAALLCLRAGMSLALSLAAPKTYRRIRGCFDES